jgi:hypothetical protein
MTIEWTSTGTNYELIAFIRLPIKPNITYHVSFHELLKLLINLSAFWKSSYRMSEYNGQSIKKWISFSTEFVLQNLQSLSFRGIYMYIVYFKNLWPRESLKIEPNMKKYIWNTYSYYSDRKKKHQREQITNLSALRIMSASTNHQTHNGVISEWGT